MKNSIHLHSTKINRQSNRFISRFFALMLLGQLPSLALANGPTTDPFPVLDTNDPQKSLILNLNFSDRFNTSLESSEIVFERPHGVAGDPPLLRVEIFDLNGEAIESFNAWHPLWVFTEDDTGKESRQILTQGAVGRLVCPFRPDAAVLTVTDVAAEQQVFSTDLLQISHPFCREHRDDPDCLNIANHPPECIANVPSQTECTGQTTQVMLDASASFDPDNDPIVSYQWTGDFLEGTSNENPATVTVSGLGQFATSLEISDDWGASAMCSANGTIVDTTQPDIQCNTPATISPPDTPVSFTATVLDSCDGASASVPVIEKFECFKFNKHGKRNNNGSCNVMVSDNTLTIRNSGGVGNHIEWLVKAVDSSGNTTMKICSVSVSNPGKGNKGPIPWLSEFPFNVPPLANNHESNPLLINEPESSTVINNETATTPVSSNASSSEKKTSASGSMNILFLLGLIFILLRKRREKI